MALRSCLLLLALGLEMPSTSAVKCNEVPLSGPFAPGRLMKCVGGNDVWRTTDANSCPEGWKIWAPESREDWVTVINSDALPVGNPHFIVDVTRDSNGCGDGCRTAMNSNNPAAMSWHTSNGEPFWLRAENYGNPSGNYHANCYMNIHRWSSPDDIQFDDAWCNFHSTDYLCQPILKADCTNRTDDVEGPCKTDDAIFRHSDCAAGVCESGNYLVFRGKTTIDDCKKYCEDGRVFHPTPVGLLEEVFSFRQYGSFKTEEELEAQTKVLSRTVETVDYPATSGYFSGYPLRDHFYVRWTGWVRIKQAGDYSFFATSDDGSRIFVNGEQLVENGGWHGMRERGGTVTLTEGLHPIRVEMFEGGGGAGMVFSWQGPDSNNAKVVVSKEAFGSPDEGTFYQEGLFNNAGPCMAYSFSSQHECIIYTGCDTVGSGSTCSADLAFLGPLSGFKTCKYAPTCAPGQDCGGTAATPAPTTAPAAELAQK